MNPRVVMTTRMLSSAVVLACAVARVSSAQSSVQSSAQSTVPPAATVDPVGVWRGTSVCLVHPSACHDEVVVYRIAPTKTADSLMVDARKVVRGAEEEMGILDCRLVRQTGRLTCAIARGVWYFRVHGDSLTGELRLLDDTRFREVRATRAP